MEALSSSLSGLPAFLAYFGIAIGFTLAFALAYTLITPHREWALIKANKPAAAVAFGGSLIGFALPLSSAIAHSVGLLDCAVWAAVALLTQVLTFFALRLIIDGLPQRIAADEVATGILVAAASIAVGLLDAASMTYAP
jgi:putative membrane protein